MKGQAKIWMRKRRADMLRDIRKSEALPPAEKAASYLKELEEQAVKRIIFRGEVKGNNQVNSLAYVFVDHLLMQEQIELFVKFNLNGNPIELKRTIQCSLLNKPRREIIQECRNYAEAIVVEFIVDELRRELVEKIIGKTIYDPNRKYEVRFS